MDISQKKVYKSPKCTGNMLDIANHEGNTNQNHSERSSHSRYNGKKTKDTSPREDLEVGGKQHVGSSKIRTRTTP